MKSIRVSSIEAYRDSSFAGWSDIERTRVKMMPSPMAMQPTAYIRNSRADKAHGEVQEIEVASAQDGDTLAVFLTWQGVSPNDRDFPDAAAVAWPVRGEPVLIMMGSKDAPLHILHWKAGKGVKSMVAAGIGLSDPGPQLKLSSQAHSDANRWYLVVTRPLGTGESISTLGPGIETKVGFAIWSGANDERAGLKAFSIDWIPFLIDA